MSKEAKTLPAAWFYSDAAISRYYEKCDVIEDHLKLASDKLLVEIDTCQINGDFEVMLTVAKIDKDYYPCDISSQPLPSKRMVSVTVPTDFAGINVFNGLHRYMGEHYDTFWTDLEPELGRLVNLAWEASQNS